jgi:hypothetical protein
MLTDTTEARPLTRTEMNVKAFDSGQLIAGLVDCAATHDFVSKYLIRRILLPTLKFKTKSPI